MSRRVTIDDVAEKAGVSYQTVSRVINNRPDVSPATRRRVQNVILEMGYRPSRVARSLATARTATIGLMVPDIANPFFSDVARGVEQSAYDKGYSVLLCNTNEDLHREVEVLQMLDDKQVDGVIVCGLRQESAPLRDAMARFSAAVLVNRRLKIGPLPTVLIDDVRGGYLATRHLLRSGHRVIGYVAGPPTSYSGRRRAEGYRQAFAELGLLPQSGWTCHCLPIVEDGTVAVQQLIHQQPDITGLFCYNDLVAVGALRACAALGLRVPDDMAIVGYDDIQLAALMTPALTTCHIPRNDIGRLALDLLLRQINGSQENTTVIDIEPQLIIRESAPA
jgi:LacI family transcriptional regulator